MAAREAVDNLKHIDARLERLDERASAMNARVDRYLEHAEATATAQQQRMSDIEHALRSTAKASADQTPVQTPATAHPDATAAAAVERSAASASAASRGGDGVAGPALSASPLLGAGATSVCGAPSAGRIQESPIKMTPLFGPGAEFLNTPEVGALTRGLGALVGSPAFSGKGTPMSISSRARKVTSVVEEIMKII